MDFYPEVYVRQIQTIPNVVEKAYPNRMYIIQFFKVNIVGTFYT